MLGTSRLLTFAHTSLTASWFIAPGVAGGLAAIVFLLCKFCILRRKNPKKLAVLASPIFFFVVPCVLTTSIIVKGSPSLNLDELPPNQTAAAILGTGAVCCALSVLFYLPWLYVQVIRKDYTVRWWHFFYGPLLWRRQPPADAEEKMAVPDYYLGHHNDKDVFNPTPAQDPEAMHRANSDDNVSGEGKEITVDQLTEQHPATLAAVEEQYSSATHDRYGRPLPPKYRHYEGSAIEPWNAVIVLRYNALPWLIHSLTAGVRTDIHKAQATQGASEKEILRLRRVHAHAEQ
jgi:sodium-dependent phosphate transporter